MNYVDGLLGLKCAGDVLNTCPPLGDKASKEISEAMAVIRRVKGIALAEPMRYDLIDMCSGNALVPVIAAHLLPVLWATAIDRKPRKGHWERAKRFGYNKEDIMASNPAQWLPASRCPVILTAVHACGALSERIIEIFASQAHHKHLVIMPCCNGALDDSFQFRLVDRYERWALKLCEQLRDLCDSGVKITCDRDNNVLSPKNIIIVASKE